ncbi:MAG: PilZ domain-containing protein [Lachnospiraceae bacterium]
MNLNEVEVGKNIEIILNLDGRKLKFNSEVREILDDSILIDPVTQEDKTVGFAKHEAMVICVAEENKPYMWNGVTIKLVKYNNEIYHQLIAAQPGAHYNRRRHYRQFVGVEGMINNLDKTHPVIVKDVSATGCAFVSGDDFEVGTDVIVSFSDADQNFVLRCKIVRKQEVSEGKKIVYGCEMKLTNHKVEKYVNEKQRQDMQRRSSSALDKRVSDKVNSES